MALDLSLLDQAEAPPPPAPVAAVAPLAAFEEDPDNPRFEPEGAEFERLVADVRRRGILQPVVVRQMPDGRLRLRFGARRYRAACRLDLPGLAYVVTEDPRQFDDYAQVAENERRRQLQPLELALFIARKLALKESKRQVAARLDIDPSALTHLLALVGEPPPLLLELYHSGRCRTPLYLYQLRKLHGVAPALVEEALAGAAAVDRRWLDGLAGLVRARSMALPALTVVAGAQEAAAAPGRLRHPVLRGCWQGRLLRVQLFRVPSGAGRIWVRCDGEAADRDLAIGELQLLGLAERAAADSAAALAL